MALGLQGDIGPIPAAIVGIAAGGLVGVVNGALVVKAGINSFIVTLATMIAVRGVAMTLSDAAPIRGADASFGASVDRALFGPLDEPLGTFLTPRILDLPGPAVRGARLPAAGPPGSQRLRRGRQPGGRAPVGHPDLQLYTFAAFVFCGLCAGLAGTVLGLSLNTGSPVVGTDSGLRVIAAVVIGGTALTGGSGSMMKTLMGVLLLALVNTAMNQAAVQVWLQSIVLGVILILVVLIDALYSAWRTRLVIAGQLGSTRAVT